MVALPSHVKKFQTNMGDITNLVDIHKRLGGSGPGRRHNLEVLHRSAIVLLVACWEAFVEDLAEQAFQDLLDRATAPSVFPTAVLCMASKPLKEARDTRGVWALAGEGWRKVLKDHQRALFDQYIGKFNTPKPAQVDELYEKLIGFSSCSKQWKWKGTTNAAAISRLDKLVTRRGQIAHRVTGGPQVRKTEVLSAVSLLLQLAVTTSNSAASSSQAEQVPGHGL